MRATQGERIVSHFRRQQIGVLRAYLACYPHRSHPRKTLIELLWPEGNPQAGRPYLLAPSARTSRRAPGAVILSATAREALDDPLFTVEWEAGRVMPLEEAVAAALVLAGDASSGRIRDGGGRL